MDWSCFYTAACGRAWSWAATNCLPHPRECQGIKNSLDVWRHTIQSLWQQRLRASSAFDYYRWNVRVQLPGAQMGTNSLWWVAYLSAFVSFSHTAFIFWYTVGPFLIFTPRPFSFWISLLSLNKGFSFLRKTKNNGSLIKAERLLLPPFTWKRHGGIICILRHHPAADLCGIIS